MLYTLKTPRGHFILDTDIPFKALGDNSAYIHYLCKLTDTPLFIDEGDGLVQSIDIDTLKIKNLEVEGGLLVNTETGIEYSCTAYELIRNDDVLTIAEKSVTAPNLIREAKEEITQKEQKVASEKKFPKHWDESVFKDLATKALIEKLK